MFFNAHLRVVVLSEEAAENGIADFIDFFYRSHEYRTDLYFVIAQGHLRQGVSQHVHPAGVHPAIAISDLLKTAGGNGRPVRPVKMTELVNDIVREGTDPTLPELR
jgi:spore germination protein KC